MSSFSQLDYEVGRCTETIELHLEPVHHRHRRRRDLPLAAHPARNLHPAQGHLRGPLLRPRRRRHGGCQQEQHQDYRRQHQQVQPGLLRL